MGLCAASKAISVKLGGRSDRGLARSVGAPYPFPMDLDFTEDEILEMQGERRKLVGMIQERYGIAQQEAERQVDEWADMAMSRF